LRPVVYGQFAEVLVRVGSVYFPDAMMVDVHDMEGDNRVDQGWIMDGCGSGHKFATQLTPPLIWKILHIVQRMIPPSTSALD
jgi:hypothetical protein